jgi:hypothetical protein
MAGVSALMEVEHRKTTSASTIALLDVDGEYNATSTRLRIVRHTLFSPASVLGYGNVWSKSYKSRAGLYKVLQTPRTPRATDAADVKIVQCLRGLLGLEGAVPPIGSLAT